MSDYQRYKKNEYYLPNAVYNKTIWEIRDYNRLKEELANILTESSLPPDGMPRNTEISDEVYKKALKRDKIRYKIQTIDNLLLTIPEEYRKGVWENIQSHTPYPKDADRTTYWRYKAQYIGAVAVEFEFI